MVVYEGPAEGLLEKVAELGGKKVRLEVMEEAAPRVRDATFWEENDRKLREIMKDAPVYPGRIFTAEDFYLPDGLGPDA